MLTLDDIKKLHSSEILNEKKGKDYKFSRVSIDTRKIKKDELFFAIKGDNNDGHKFILKNTGKISTAVVNRKWYNKLSNKEKASYKNLTLILVKDTTNAFGELARNYRRKFLIPVIAVSGSNGKTGTRDLIRYVLLQKYNLHSTKGNLNNQFGLPLTIFDLNKKHELSLLELGTNHFGEIDYLCKICEPQFGIITNIAREHLEFLKNLKGVLKAEGELFDYLKNVYGTFFLNLDDKLLKVKVGNYPLVISFGKNRKADVKAKLIGFEHFNPVIEISYKDKQIEFRSSMVGYPAFYSSVCAAAVGFYFDVPLNKMTKALSEFKSTVTGRNDLNKVNDFWLINDTYNSNPDSVLAAFENIKGFKMTSKAHIVLSDMLELGRSSKAEHYKIGKMALQYGFQNLYTVGTDSIETFKGAKGLKNNFYFNDIDSLLKVLKLRIKKDDIVLVKGSHGMKMELIIPKLTNLKIT